MTADYLANIVEKCFNKVDFDKISKDWSSIQKYSNDGRKTDEWINTRI
jgi:hypothetical protein